MQLNFTEEILFKKKSCVFVYVSETRREGDTYTHTQMIERNIVK